MEKVRMEGVKRVGFFFCSSFYLYLFLPLCPSYCECGIGLEYVTSGLACTRLRKARTAENTFFHFTLTSERSSKARSSGIEAGSDSLSPRETANEQH